MQPHLLNRISFSIIQSAIQVHRALGPGLFENIYRTCVIYELRERSLNVVAEQIVPIRYGPLMFEAGYRLDLLVEDQVVVELKAVETILPGVSGFLCVKQVDAFDLLFFS
jgi:GxxExxY protein